jgi:hypothetical protein
VQGIVHIIDRILDPSAQTVEAIWQKLPKGSFQEAALIGRFLIVDANMEQPRLAMSAKAFNFSG